ncbi:MAG: IS1380 family transposase [Planctomycetota bacterium]|jgi:hypothetical protein
MTDCTQRSLLFSSVGKKKIHADFNGGRLTSDGGVLLLRETEKRLGLIDAIAEGLPDPRHPSLIKHSQREMLAQRIFSIALGYEDLNDHATLRHDPALQVATERIRKPNSDHGLSSPSTLCRLENRVNRESLVRISEIFVEQFIASHHTPPEELILDFDATDDPLHGKQEGRFFHGYYDCYCFLPLYVFCGDQLLAAYLRESGIDAAKHSRAILKLLVDRFREVWPEVRIILRGDSGFCRWRLMRWCERNGVDYILGLARNPVLENRARFYMIQAEHAFQKTGEKQQIFRFIRYGAQTWDRKRRVIVKAERMMQGPNFRFVVTSLPGDPEELYKDLYCQRGEMENRIKEQQLGLFADRTSCHAFLANQFRLLLSSAAYVLMEALRRLGLSGTELAQAQVQTIRLKLFKVAARVRTSVRRVAFHLASSYPYRSILIHALGVIRLLPTTAAIFR